MEILLERENLICYLFTVIANLKKKLSLKRSNHQRRKHSISKLITTGVQLLIQTEIQNSRTIKKHFLWLQDLLLKL